MAKNKFVYRHKKEKTHKRKEKQRDEGKRVRDENLTDKVTFRIPDYLKSRVEESVKKGEFKNQSEVIRVAIKEFYNKR